MLFNARPTRMTSHSSHPRRYAWVVAPLALFALISGCAARSSPGGAGSSTGATASPNTSPRPNPGTYRPDDLVLRVELVHGFMRENFVAQAPMVSVYGDGRVITEGPQIAIDPRPALPNLVVRHISPAGVNALVNRALDRDVGHGRDYGQPNIYDAPSTRFTLLTDAGVLVTDVYALGVTDSHDGLTDAQRSARQMLQNLIDELTDLPRTLGPEAGEEKPYEATALAAVSREWTEPATDRQPQPERAWPGPALPGEPMGRLPEVRCLTVGGAVAPTVLAAAATATDGTPWASGGKRWRVEFRPLLPDETSCADLI
jgi:hypothetical protein